MMTTIQWSRDGQHFIPHTFNSNYYSEVTAEPECQLDGPWLAEPLPPAWFDADDWDEELHTHCSLHEYVSHELGFPHQIGEL